MSTHLTPTEVVSVADGHGRDVLLRHAEAVSKLADMGPGTSFHRVLEETDKLAPDDQIRRGAHRSTAELEAEIAAYIDAHNADPKPFRWTKTADDILAAVERFCHRTIAVQKQCE